MPTSAVSVSGTPCTWPEPTTVTRRGLSPTRSGVLSQADAATTRPNASTTRNGSLACRVMGMVGTLVARETAGWRVAVYGCAPVQFEWLGYVTSSATGTAIAASLSAL